MKKLILLLILIFSLPVAAQNFTIGKSTFLLNGKPFTVKAAELYSGSLLGASYRDV